MTGPDYSTEMHTEVEEWPESLAQHLYERVEAHVVLLGECAETLSEPYARHLGGKLRELRIRLNGRDVRVTYWLAPRRRVDCEAGQGSLHGDADVVWERSTSWVRRTAR